MDVYHNPSHMDQYLFRQMKKRVLTNDDKKAPGLFYIVKDHIKHSKLIL